LQRLQLLGIDLAVLRHEAGDTLHVLNEQRAPLRRVD
jgi:hypothetical protein